MQHNCAVILPFHHPRRVGHARRVGLRFALSKIAIMILFGAICSSDGHGNISSVDAAELPGTETTNGDSVPVAASDETPSSLVPPDVLIPPSSQEQPSDELSLVSQVEELVQPSRIGSSLKIILTMSVISLAPAILLMTTSFIRISIVLGLLRQALGAQQLPPNQVTTSLSLFMTMMIMWPVWTRVYEDAIEPYSDPNVAMSVAEAWEAGSEPVRLFMISQIENTENTDDVLLFMKHVPGATENPTHYGEVPTQALLPAFVLSELKTAFLLGFQIYLPFLIIDIVIATLTTSMGMVMLPPTMMSLPFKLLLFVLVDGWHLIVGMLLESFRMTGSM